MKKFLFLVGAVLLALAANADFLITNRKTSIKTEPSSSSEVILQVAEWRVTYD
jgi:hypothetical protein